MEKVNDWYENLSSRRMRFNFVGSTDTNRPIGVSRDRLLCGKQFDN